MRLNQKHFSIFSKQTKAIFFVFSTVYAYLYVFVCICMRMCISLKFIQKYYSNKYQYKSTPLTEHIRRIIKTNILHIFISDK